MCTQVFIVYDTHVYLIHQNFLHKKINPNVNEIIEDIIKSSMKILKHIHVQWGLHLRIGSTFEPLMCISFHLLKNNDPKIAKMLWT